MVGLLTLNLNQIQIILVTKQVLHLLTWGRFSMKINDLYDTDHDKVFAENIQQKCVIINQLYEALTEKDAQIKELREQLGSVNVTPETTNRSITSSSRITQVPSLSVKLERTWIGRPWRIANFTERVWSTFAPRLAISSISS